MKYIISFHIKDICAAFKCADSFIKMTTKHDIDPDIYLGFEDEKTAVMVISNRYEMVRYKIENNYNDNILTDDTCLPEICIEGSTETKYGILFPNDVVKQLYDFFNIYKDKGFYVGLYINNVSDMKYEIEFVYDSRKSGFTYDNNKPMKNFWDVITKFDNLPKSYNFALPIFIPLDRIEMINKFFGKTSNMQIDALENTAIFKFTYREKNDYDMEQQIEFYCGGFRNEDDE